MHFNFLNPNFSGQGIFEINIENNKISQHNVLSPHLTELNTLYNIIPTLFQGGQFSVKLFFFEEPLNPNIKQNITQYFIPGDLANLISFSSLADREAKQPYIGHTSQFLALEDFEFNTVLYSGTSGTFNIWYAGTYFNKPFKIFKNTTFFASYFFYFTGGPGDSPHMAIKNSLYDFYSSSSSKAALSYNLGGYVFTIPEISENANFPILTPTTSLFNYQKIINDDFISKNLHQFNLDSSSRPSNYWDGICLKGYTLGASSSAPFASDNVQGSEWARHTAMKWGEINSYQYHHTVHRVHGHLKDTKKLFWEEDKAPTGTGKVSILDNGFIKAHWANKIPHYYRIIILPDSKFYFEEYLTSGFFGGENRHKPYASRVPYILSNPNTFYGFDSIPHAHGLFIDNSKVGRIFEFWFLYYSEQGATFINIENGNIFYLNSETNNLVSSLNLVDVAHILDSPEIYLGCSESGIYKVNVVHQTIEHIYYGPVKSLTISKNGLIYAIDSQLRLFQIKGKGEIFKGHPILSNLTPERYRRIRVNPNDSNQLFLEMERLPTNENVGTGAYDIGHYWIDVSNNQMILASLVTESHSPTDSYTNYRDLVWLDKFNYVVATNDSPYTRVIFYPWGQNSRKIVNGPNGNRNIIQNEFGHVLTEYGFYNPQLNFTEPGYLNIKIPTNLDSGVENGKVFPYPSVELSVAYSLTYIHKNFVLRGNLLQNIHVVDGESDQLPLGLSYSWENSQWVPLNPVTANPPQGHPITPDIDIQLNNNLIIRFDGGTFDEGDWYGCMVYDGFYKDKFSDLDAKWFFSNSGVY